MPGSKKVLLQVVLHDSPALKLVSAPYLKLVEKSYLQRYPERSVRLVEAADREELAGKLGAALREGEAVSHLFVSAHGERQSRRSRTWSVMQGIGGFAETPPAAAPAVDEPFAAFFAPIRRRLLEDAHLILHSCHLLGGDPATAVRRAATLGRYFGLKDWSVYGADGLETLVPPVRSRAFVVASSYAVALAAPFLSLLSFVLAGVVTGALPGHPGTLAAVVALLCALGVLASAAASSRAGGLLLRFRDGRPAGAGRVRRNADLAGVNGLR